MKNPLVRNLFLVTSLPVACGQSVWRHAAAQRLPNFIMLMGEGQGWNSTSVQMDDAVPASKSSFIQTPNLERLAKEGMRFANAQQVG